MDSVVARDFAAARDTLNRQLNGISQEANSNRLLCLSSLTSELNQLLSQTLLVDIQQQQSNLERNYHKLPEFQELLKDMAWRVLYRNKIRDSYLANHYRERQRRVSFMFLKEYAQAKKFEKRMLRKAGLVLTKKAKDRIFQAWRSVKQREKANRLLHAYTRECEIQVEEHKKLGHKMISQLEQELEKKELEYIQEERKLNQLNEKYSVIKNADKTINVLQKNKRFDRESDE
jgi:hypothetical protein